MAECTDPIPLENLDYCPTDEIVAGISEVGIHFAGINDFETIAWVPKLSDATDLESAGTISESHTFKTDRGFHKVYAKPESGMLDGAQAGEKGNLSIANGFVFTIPSTGARAVGWVRKHLNMPCIVIVVQRNGEKKQIGSPNSPAYMSEITPTNGQKPGDAVGITVKVSDSIPHPSPVYAGTIQEFPAPAPEGT